MTDKTATDKNIIALFAAMIAAERAQLFAAIAAEETFPAAVREIAAAAIAKAAS